MALKKIPDERRVELEDRLGPLSARSAERRRFITALAIEPIPGPLFQRMPAVRSKPFEFKGASKMTAILAWHYKKYSSDQYLADLKKQARKGRGGHWSDPHAMPPWEYRRENRSES